MELEAVLRRFLHLRKRVSGLCIRNIQTSAAYRRIARSYRPKIQIVEAGRKERHDIHMWLNPTDSPPPTLSNPDVTTLVAKRGKKVIGFVELVRCVEDEGLFKGYWVFSLMVSEFFRGMGIGESLTSAIIARALKEGAEEILALVRSDNERALALCRKFGGRIKVIPALEALLEKEKRLLGCKRVVMSKSFVTTSRLNTPTDRQTDVSHKDGKRV